MLSSNNSTEKEVSWLQAKWNEIRALCSPWSLIPLCHWCKWDGSVSCVIKMEKRRSGIFSGEPGSKCPSLGTGCSGQKCKNCCSGISVTQSAGIWCANPLRHASHTAKTLNLLLQQLTGGEKPGSNRMTGKGVSIWGEIKRGVHHGCCRRSSWV